MPPPPTGVKAWGRGHSPFGFQTYFLRCLSNYTRYRGFRPVAVFAPRLNGISRADTSSSPVPFIPPPPFALSHSPPAEAPRLSLLPKLSKNNEARGAHCGRELFYALCGSSAIHSFFRSRKKKKTIERERRGAEEVITQRGSICSQVGGWRRVLSVETERSARNSSGDTNALQQNDSVFNRSRCQEITCAHPKTHSLTTCQSLRVT